MVEVPKILAAKLALPLTLELDLSIAHQLAETAGMQGNVS
jgi:hypothetical protein